MICSQLLDNFAPENTEEETEESVKKEKVKKNSESTVSAKDQNKL